MAIATFQRVEKKFLLTPKQYEDFTKKLSLYMHPDEYGQHTISNLYFDTPDNLLVRRSIEKPHYKEKLRLRSYGIPTRQSKVFLEIKKKYDGIVYKRRISCSLTEAYAYIEKGEKPDTQDQIFREIDYFIQFYEGLIPRLYLAYDRVAWAGNTDDTLRITFDQNIRSRWDDLYLEHGDYGDRLLGRELILMEVKVPGAYPIWMSSLLNELEIYPTSFSKYGKIYTKKLLEERDRLQKEKIQTLEQRSIGYQYTRSVSV